MKFFHFRQNNSGGIFKGPAQNVVVEAENAEDANKRVLEVDGVYFDGCSEGVDCPCCGDRWFRQWSYEVGDDVPSTYGDPVVFGDGDGDVLVVYANGEKKRGLFHW